MDWGFGSFRWNRHLILTCLAIISLSGHAADWQGELQGGGRVVVDPDTNRAMVRRNGVETPLWDGVHRLRDGSTLIIRSGVAVPNQGILESRDEAEGQTALPPRDESTPMPATTRLQPSCVMLVDKVCGERGACVDTEGCDIAHQLLEMSRQGEGEFANPADGHCTRGLVDEAIFPRCRR